MILLYRCAVPIVFLERLLTELHNAELTLLDGMADLLVAAATSLVAGKWMLTALRKLDDYQE